ncbi:MAG: hypothetical protein JST82_02225 [Bacteroidetes bacterium]|nr:hypothetical protein [Bacteroidota bacterium]
MKKQILMAAFIAISGIAQGQSNNAAATVKENPVIIGNQSGFKVSKSQLLKNPVLRLQEANKDYHITSYQISYVSKEKGSDAIGPFLVMGDNINTGKAAEILKMAQPGDRIFFEGITAVNSDGSKRLSELTAAVKIE